MDHTFWTMHLDGPKHLRQKWANRWMLGKKMEQKNWAILQGQKISQSGCNFKSQYSCYQKQGQKILTSSRQTHN